MKGLKRRSSLSSSPEVTVLFGVFYGGVTIEQSNSQFTVTGVEEEGGDGILDLSLFSQLVVLLVTAFPSQALLSTGGYGR